MDGKNLWFDHRDLRRLRKTLDDVGSRVALQTHRTAGGKGWQLGAASERAAG